MSNLFYNHKKLFFILATITMVAATLLTVIVSQQQQQIKQRAASGDVSIYFASTAQCNTPATLPLNTPSPVEIFLCIKGKEHKYISGFDIALTANNLFFQTADAGKDAPSFTTSLEKTDSTIKFKGFMILSKDSQLTGVSLDAIPLNLLKITTSVGAGNIDIKADITSLSKEGGALSVNAMPFSFTSITNTTSVPAPTTAPTSAPTQQTVPATNPTAASVPAPNICENESTCDACVTCYRSKGSYQSGVDCKTQCTKNGVAPTPFPTGKKYLCEPGNIAPYFSNTPCPTPTPNP